MPPGEVVRLLPSDLDDLSLPAERPSSLKRIRDHHHLIARLVAEGKRTSDIASQVGLSMSRVSILKGDPAFQQLVEMYRTNLNQLHDANFATNDQKMAMLEAEAADELLDRMHETPEEFSSDQLMKIWEFCLDRRVGKITKNYNLNVNRTESLADLVAARRRREDQLSAPLDEVAVEPGPDSKPMLPVPEPSKGGP